MLSCYVQAMRTAPLSYSVVISMFVLETSITQNIYTICVLQVDKVYYILVTVDEGILETANGRAARQD